MSNFPSQLDDDATLPPVNDNITETGAEAINACRDALFAIESEIGLGASGSAGSIAARLGVSLDPAGAIKPSAIAAMGLVTLPIFNSHIADNAQIIEAKLRLDFRTQDLFNYITDLSRDVNEAIGWIDGTGVKLDPHIFGALYRHQLSDIDVNSNPALYLKNKFNTLRDNTNSYTLINDLNSDMIQHQRADGSLTSFQNVVTFNGSVYPSNFAHLAAGIFLNTSRFSTISQAANSVQLFAEYIDSQSIFLYGSRIQNLYSNGISRISRSSTLAKDGYGPFIVPPTTATTYLLNNGSSSFPVDDIDIGDDIIEFTPDTSVTDNNLFDTQFALVKPGDIVRVNYGGIEVPFIIREKKYIQGDLVKKFLIRIAGKNLFYRTNASARIDKPLFNPDKFGVLAVSGANNEFSSPPSLIVSSPRAAVALGLGFDPQLLDNKHYLLYLALFPTGHPSDGYTILPGIDITGNQGTTPGAYTLESIIEITNNAFRRKGYNYRFVAFQYKGEFGIMLADSFNNAGFSIINGVVNDTGGFEQSFTDVFFPNNVVGLFGVSGKVAADPLGFGSNGSAVASPPYLGNFLSPEQALIPTKLFLPLKRNNYYVNANEIEKLNIDVGQARDGYGDGYWIGEIITRVVFPGNRVKTSYRIFQDLSTSKLQVGKTVVIQSDGYGGLVDYGRFIIEDIAFNTCPGTGNTDLTIYDAIHGAGFSPTSSLGVPSPVKIYFSADSVGFNIENSTDETSITPSFKRHFEVLADQNGDVFTHERARMNINGSNITVNGVTLYGSAQLSAFDIIKVTPKLRGYKFFFGTTAVNKINLHITSFDNATGVFSGNLAMWDGVTFTRLGPTITSRVGELTRFYDESNIDYIDLIFSFANSGTFSNQNIDIQLFPTLQLDEEVFPIATCQVNDVTGTVGFIKDIRDFGNVSEKQLTTSALNYISATDRLLHQNGVLRGFDITDDVGNPIADQIRISGGGALVNGNVVLINNNVVSIPIIREKDPNSSSTYDIKWALCVNDKNEFQAIPLFNAGFVDVLTTNFNRVFLAINPITGGTYNIDAINFSDLINVRKDLCLLYIVSSTVTGSGLSTAITLAIKDVRRYVGDQDSIIVPTVTPGASQGNFKTVLSAIDWLRYNNAYQNQLIIKGNHEIDSTPDMFDGMELQISSQSPNVTLTFNSDINVSFTHFKDLYMIINGNFTATNCTFENCNVDVIGGDLNCQYLDIRNTNKLYTFYVEGVANISGTVNVENVGILAIGDINISNGFFNFFNVTLTAGGKEEAISDIFISGDAIRTTSINKANIFATNDVTINGFNVYDAVIGGAGVGTFNLSKFRNCTVTMSSTTTTTTSSYEFSSYTSTGACTATDVKFINCILSFPAGGTFNNVLIDPSTVTVGATINVTNTTITDSVVNVSAVNGFALNNNFTFSRNNVTWTGAPVSGFVSSNIVNAGNALMFKNVSTSISNIKVTDNTFSTSMQLRFPFFSLLLTAYIATVSSVDVSSNKFVSNTPANDVRAVISVVATNTTLSSSGYPRFPTLIDVHFDRNVCNLDQLIIISGTRDPVFGYMNGASPVVINTTISGNICGTVGYFISALGAFDGNNAGSPNNGVTRDKANKLIIADNYCKLISNLDQEGDYICFRATAYPSNNFYEEVVTTVGETSIINNTVNWIQVGAGGYSNATSFSGVNIIGNTICPANPSFLSNFTGYILQSVTPANVGIMLRRENNAESLSMSVISSNNISQKYTTAADGYVQNVYHYDAAIVCFNNANILNNNIFGVINNVNNTYLYIWSQNIQIICNNIFRRGYGPVISAPNTKVEPTSGENQYMDNLPCLSYIYTNGGTSNKRTLISNNIFHDQNVNSASEVSAGRPSGNVVISNPAGSGIFVKNNVVNQTYFTTGIGIGVGN